MSEWKAAIFMPGDTQDSWLLAEYPPRIYVVTRDALAIYPHPACNDSAFVTPLSELIEIESEKALLYGELDFHTKTRSQSFRYNAVQQRQMSPFLRVLRSLWLPVHNIPLPSVFFPEVQSIVGFRCWYALQEELDPSEKLYNICFQPALQRRKKVWYFTRTQTVPPHLFAVTNRRVMLVSEQTGEANDPYGIQIRHAALSSLMSAEVCETVVHRSLSLGLEHGRAWEFLFLPEQAASIASAVELLNELSHLRGNAAEPSATGLLEASSAEKL
jgi:hypothetical protein